MLNLVKLISLLATLVIVNGCSSIAHQLDASWADEKMEYPKSTPLPPLEVSPELVRSKTAQTNQ